MKKLLMSLKEKRFGVPATGPSCYIVPKVEIDNQVLAIQSSVYPPEYIDFKGKSLEVQTLKINDIWKNIDRLLHPEFYN